MKPKYWAGCKRYRGTTIKAFGNRYKLGAYEVLQVDQKVIGHSENIGIDPWPTVIPIRTVTTITLVAEDVSCVGLATE